MPHFGWISDCPDIRDWSYSAHPEVLKSKEVSLPAAVDLTLLVNQYDFGSCTGNAIAAVAQAQ